MRILIIITILHNLILHVYAIDNTGWFQLKDICWRQDQEKFTSEPQRKQSEHIRWKPFQVRNDIENAGFAEERAVVEERTIVEVVEWLVVKHQTLGALPSIGIF